MFRFDQAVRGELTKNWPALIIAISALFFGFSTPTFSLPFLFSEVIKEFGWTREQATLIASMKYLTGAIVALVVGRFVDTIGVRWALIATIAVGGIALVNFLWIGDLTSYYISGVLLGVAGPGCMVGVIVLVARNFHAAQGTAMGVALLGSSFGSIVVPFVITALLNAYGWREAFALLSAGIWLIAIPMILFAPAKLFGASAVPDKADGEQPVGARLQQLVATMKTTPFWLVAGAIFLVSVADQGFIQHQVLILKDLDMDPTFIAAAVSAMGVIGLASRVVIGNVLDSTSNKGLAFVYMLLTAASLLAFMIVNPLILILFVVFRAVGHVGVILDGSVMTKHNFGLNNFGTLVGVYTAIGSLGFATGPWLMGRLYDQSGSYDSSYLTFAAMTTVAAVLVWLLKPAYWLSPAQAKARREAAAGAPAEGTAA